ncbi:MAG TPA: DUF1080 domain-containing protein [Phycisphaerae bacterium]|nr:DUF1080 domain-containing protein [Phycisphaerae bacterium]HOJ53501.1 DUF1080 domain-containing protein [Phycisphaerae bacterium]HOL25342.1 DUF1080 domain-containing protein [Phycisphaerae bacterium]HPP21846.1 DUF1080 domain-containing protein [Phycisphaerae bacterium]HPU34875.1 DUF1080 domain-containing protein [Phycisphaerae bacterium]
MRRIICGCVAFAVLMFSNVNAPVFAAEAADPAVGRWDITLGDGPTPCWLEITKRDGQYAGRFLYISASVFELKQVKVDGNKVEFECTGVKGGGPGHTFIGTIEGDTITGTVVPKNGEKMKWTARRFVPRIDLTGTWTIEGQDNATLRFRQRNDRIMGVLLQNSPTRLTDIKLDGYALQFTAGDKQCAARVKGDVLEGTLGDAKFTAKRQREWGEPIELFNGKDLTGWKPLGDPAKFNWKVVDGILHCDGRAANIVTEETFGDFKLHVEFKVPQGGNSGVYLRGRYEIQVADSHGRPPGEHDCGGLYSRLAPKENASKPAGEWQTFDITLIDHYMTVVWNGKLVHDNVEIEGITGGAIDSKENEPGPIYLQGDHTSIDYRKITLTPAKAPVEGQRRGRSR